MSGEQNLKTENYIRDILFIFFAQRNLILGTTAVIFILAVLVSLFWPRTYGAYGSILLRGKDVQKSPQALERVDFRSYPIGKEDLFSEIELIRSPDVIRAALKSLEDQGDPAANYPVYKIRGKLTAQLVPASLVIQLGLEGDNQEHLVKIMDAILVAYIAYRTEVHFPKQAVVFYSDQAERFKAELAAVEKELMALVEYTDVADPKAEMVKNMLVKETLEQDLYQMRVKAVELRESVGFIGKLLEREEINHFAFIDNSTIHQFAARLIDLSIERGKLARNYQPNSSSITRIDNQIRQTMTLLRREVLYYQQDLASHLAGDEANIAILEEQLAKIDAQNVALKRQELRQDSLRKQAALLRTSYNTFQKRREEASMNSNLEQSYSSFFVRILARAYASGNPLFPKKDVLIPMGLIAGLITGFALGFLREYFDHTFKNPRDVEHFAGLPLLFSLPVLKVKSSQEPLSAKDPPGENLPDDPRLES